MMRLPPPRGLDEPQPQLVEHLLEHLALFGGEVAARLLIEQREDLDHLRGAFEVRLGAARRSTGSGRSPKWIAAVLASDSTNAVNDSAARGIGHLAKIIKCPTSIATPRSEFTRLVEIMATLRGAGRLPVGSRADDRLAEAVRARGNLRGARGDRPPRSRRALRGARRLRVRGGLSRAARGRSRTLHDRRLAAEHRRQAGAAASARLRAGRRAKRRSTPPGQVRTRWEEIKAQERRRQADEAEDAARAGSRRRCRRCCARITSASRAASVGFDWTRAGDVVGKIQEEVDELREVVGAGGRRSTRRAPRRKWATCCSRSPTCRASSGIEPETALRKANDKFTRRFTAMERAIAAVRASDEGDDARRAGGGVAAAEIAATD